MSDWKSWFEITKLPLKQSRSCFLAFLKRFFPYFWLKMVKSYFTVFFNFLSLCYAQCLDLVNDFECMCAPGYAGTMCSDDVNECLSNPCGRHGICSQVPSRPDKYRLVVLKCQIRWKKYMLSWNEFWMLVLGYLQGWCGMVHSKFCTGFGKK